MTTFLTDRVAIRTALYLAIDTEESLIDAYNSNEAEEAVKTARKSIEAFKRVLARYYPGEKRKDPIKGAKKVNIFDVMLGKTDPDAP